ncbi:chromatin assembly factor 1 subunit A-like [Ptychodera flava]|uniref:chromatin assembly factor 1 subunit A-like n=1 Tax=Ptychodera flava TaxID=63121 RepID=UPI00396A78EF
MAGEPFYSNIPPARPAVLLFDSHISHLDFEISKLAEENKILLYRLLPNASHFLQPCDVALFGPLKAAWTTAVREFMIDNPGEEVTKKTFARVFKTAWQRSATMKNISLSFSKSGIYPLDRSKISSDLLLPSTSFGDCTAMEEDGETSVNKAEEAAKKRESSLLDLVEEVMSTPEKEKYRQRIEEGFDLPGSPSFRIWKRAYQDSQSNSITASPENSSATECNVTGTETDSCVTDNVTSTATKSPTNVGSIDGTPTRSDSSSDTSIIGQASSPSACTSTPVTSDHGRMTGATPPSKKVSPNLNKVLAYPEIGKRKRKPGAKKFVQCLPSFLNGSEAKKFYQEKHLNFLRSIKERQDRLRAKSEQKKKQEETMARKKQEREEKKKERERNEEERKRIEEKGYHPYSTIKNKWQKKKTT